FLLQGGTLAAGFAILPGVAHAARLPLDDPEYRELARRALDAARGAGAAYADVRISRNRSQAVSTRERRVTGFQDSETFGFGVRVLVNGAWGFAPRRDLNLQEVERVARQAGAQARASAAAVRRPVELAPVEVYPDATWRSPIEVDP